jgi:hypothetical protein
VSVATGLQTVPWTLVYLVPERALDAPVLALVRKTVLGSALIIVLAFAAGIGIHAPHGQKLGQALFTTPDGPPTPEIMEMIREPVPWVVGHAVPFMILAVASNMVNKPGTAVSILVIVIGAVVGAALGMVGQRRVRA